MISEKQIFVAPRATITAQFLCFTAEEAGSTISMSAVGSAPAVYLETSPTVELGAWTEFTVGSTTITLPNVGDKVYFRAKRDNKLFGTSSSAYNKFDMTGKIAASGNINTLLKADGLIDNLTGRNCCYFSMFNGCTSLTQAPELPATTLVTSCYQNMFNGCTSLAQTPDLPATNLANSCYNNMFKGCTSLAKAPEELPATNLNASCYYGMFNGCTSLTKAPVLPAKNLAHACYYYMFNGCTSLAQAPYLPATEMKSNCYGVMFGNCKQINEIKTAQTSFDYCDYWLLNVSQTGTFVCSSILGTNETISRGVSACPDGWTVVNI